MELIKPPKQAGGRDMKFKDTQGRYESLSARMMKLQITARTLWHSGDKARAEEIGEVIGKIADVRLRYIYQ